MDVPMMDVAAIAPAKRPTYQPTAANEMAYILGCCQDSIFDILLEQLLEFKVVFGHCLVPFDYAENPPLARWVAVQRTQHSQGRMKASHAQQLESIGFSWNPPLAPPELVAFNSKQSNTNKVTNTTIVDPTASLVPANERQEMREQKQMRGILSAVLSKRTPKSIQEETNQEARGEEELLESNGTEAPRARSNETRADESGEEMLGLEKTNQEAGNLELAKSNDIRTDESMLEADLAEAPKQVKKTDPALFEKSFEHLTFRRMAGPHEWDAAELQRNGATAASQEESVAASPHKFEYPIGTRIDKEFDGYGWFSGKVVSYRDDFYHVLYEDGDEEEFEDEISDFVSPFQDEVDDSASDSESSAFEMNDLELYSRKESFEGDLSRSPVKKRRTWSKKGKTSRKHVVSGKGVKYSIPPSHGFEKKKTTGQVAAYNTAYYGVAFKETAAALRDSEPVAESQQVGKEQAITIPYNEIQKDKNCPADMPGLMDEMDGVRGQVVQNDELSSSRDGGKATAVSKMQAVPHKSSRQTTCGTKRRAEEDPQASRWTNRRRSLTAEPDEELQNIFHTNAESFIDVRNKKQLIKGSRSKIAASSSEKKSASVFAGVSHAIPRKERQLHDLANPANGCSKNLPGSKGNSKNFPGSKGNSKNLPGSKCSSKIEFLAEAPPQKKKRSCESKSSSRKVMLPCSKYQWSASRKHVFDRSNKRQTFQIDNILVKRARECRHPVISDMSIAGAAPTGIPEAPPPNEKKTQKAKAQRMSLKSICRTIESEEEKYGGH